MADDQTILAKLKVQNRAAFVTDMNSASGSVLRFGAANDEAAAGMKLSRVESFALRQGLYTLRRELFYGTAAILGGTAAILHLGFSFDAAKQEGTTAFTAILGSATAARNEMTQLTKTSFSTGLSLSSITGEAKTMQGFGFAIQDVNTDVKALGDFAQRSGASFSSLVDVFDQIKSQGKLTSVTLRTLTHDGVAALPILSQQLHLTAAQAAALQKGKLIIPAQYALPALARGIQNRANQLGPSLTQTTGSTHQLVGAILGQAEQGLFSGSSSLLGGLNKRLYAGFQGMQNGGGVSGLLTGIDPSGRLLTDWRSLAAVIGAVKSVAVDLWKIFQLGLPLVTGFGVAVGLLAHQTGVLRVAVVGLATWYLITRARMAAVAVWQAILTARFWLQGQAIVAAGLAMRLFGIEAEEGTVGMLALNAAMDVNPVLLIVEGVAALGFALYVLGVHFNTVVRAAEDFWGWLTKIERITHLDIVLNFRIGRGGRIADLLLNSLPGVGQLHQLYTGIRGLAGGGTVSPGGTALVGERGPELLSNRGGTARVTPLGGGRNSHGFGELLTEVRGLRADLRDGKIGISMDGLQLAEGLARRRAVMGAIS